MLARSGRENSDNGRKNPQDYTQVWKKCSYGSQNRVPDPGRIPRDRESAPRKSPVDAHLSNPGKRFGKTGGKASAQVARFVRV